ncbi:hypothetical protein NC652_038499 [Populus alba x Populus x berolinensis]|nr:hypothetical protein NC652_038499 [Populus alba x Populus x berolinensis]
MIAPRHGLNCPGLHVCACDTCASASNIAVTTVTTMKKDAIFIFSDLVAAIFLFFSLWHTRNDASSHDLAQQFIER